MSSDWPFGGVSRSGARSGLERIAALDLSRYGYAMHLQDELKRFFGVRLVSGKRIPMQSQSVDALWHKFILDTRRYREFCDEVFGEYLDHEPGDFPLDPEFEPLYQRLCGQGLTADWSPAPSDIADCA